MRLVYFSFLLFFIQQLTAITKTLTDTQGRSIEVELIAKTEDAILVKRADGLEFEIQFKLLSEEDRTSLLAWEPPEPETTHNPIDAVVIMRSKEEDEKGYGSGFLAHVHERTYIYTNQHVISDIMNVEAIDSSGNKVRLGALEISNSQDLARFRVSQRPALIISDDVEIDEEVTALGNSKGAGVITSEQGKVQGIGHSEIEVSAEFVPGNSGGPVINNKQEVIGVATYAKLENKKPDWVEKDTRYSGVRRFTIRPSRITDWRTITRDEYERQRGELNVAFYKFDQAYWTFQMLDEGKGYISNLPVNWHRDTNFT